MIRLILLIILLLISLLAVFRAPAYHLWLLSIGVTEFPIVFASATIIALAAGFWLGKYQLPGTLVGLIALVLLLSPIFRSYLISRHLKADLVQALRIQLVHARLTMSAMQMESN